MKPLQNTQGLSSNHAAQLAKNFSYKWHLREQLFFLSA